MFSWLANAWRVPELRRRLLFTALVLALYRLGSWIPAPGVDAEAIDQYLSRTGGIFDLLNLFSGGALSQFSLFALGIMPYVTASIIVQLMTVVIPRLSELQKEGESGYAKINQYTRYLTVALAAAQALGYAFLFKNQGVLQANNGRMVLIIVTLTVGTILLMWMGEQITKRGIGNGISILIFASILTGLPLGITAWWNGGPMERIFFPLIGLSIVAAVVFVQEGQRRIPIQYAKRMVGRRMTSGGSTYLPLRVNMAGVIPVIFAAAILAFPPTVAQYFPATQDFVNTYFQPGRLALPDDRGRDDRGLRLLLHGGAVQPRRPGRQPAQARGLHPGHPAGPADRAVPRPRPDAADLARVALPRDGRHPAEPLHPLRRLLAGLRRSARRHVCADRRRRRARHHAPDGVADDDAQLRGLPAVNLLVLGPQGSGKGTQASRLAEEREIPHVSTGDMFRASIAARTPLGRRVEPILASGELVPDELTVALIRERLSEPDATRGFVLDGFPRNLAQAEALDAMLTEIDRELDLVLFFDLDQVTSTERLRKRAVIEGRDDDTPDAIARRLELYHEQTAPLVELYRASGRLVPIRAERTIDEVANEIAEALDLLDGAPA